MKFSDKVLSVIIPVYNGQDYIVRCLDSIYSLPLKYDEFEVIVVDDCSTDGTPEILVEYAGQRSNMTVLRQQMNKRQGAARNRGMDVAHGKYIAFVDADDCLVSEGVMNAIRAMDESMVDICYFDIEYESDVDNWTPYDMPIETHNAVMQMSTYLDKYYCTDFNAAWRTLYRRTFLQGSGVRFEEGVRWEDCDWTLKVYLLADRVQFVEGVGYRYCHNENNTSRQDDALATAEHIFAGCRLRMLAESIQQNLPNLSARLNMEAKGRYACWYLNRSVLIKKGVKHLHEVYRLVDNEYWIYLRKFQ